MNTKGDELIQNDSLSNVVSRIVWLIAEDCMTTMT